MATHKIRIPKLSLLKDEDGLFVNLHEFLAVLESLYYRSQDMNANSSASFLTRELKFIENLPSAVLTELVNTLQNMASLKNEARKSIKIGKSEIFSLKLFRKWRKCKTEMNTLAKQYNGEIGKVRACQAACWKSRGKVQKYCLMVDMAQKSLQYHTEDQKEYDARIISIKELKADLGKRLQYHCENLKKYYEALDIENKSRQELTRLSDTLEEDITDGIKMKIQNTLNVIAHGNNSYDIDLDEITKCIYSLICRTCTLTVPPSDITSPAFNKRIIYPDEQRNMYDPVNKKKIIASHSYDESVLEVKSNENTKESNKHIDIQDTAEDSIDNTQDIVENVVGDIIDNKQDNTEEPSGNHSNTEDQTNPEVTTQPGSPVKKKGLFASFKKKFTRKKKEKDKR